MELPPDTYTGGGVVRTCDQTVGPKLRINKHRIEILFSKNISPSWGEQQKELLWAWNQTGKSGLAIEVPLAIRKANGH